MEQLGKRLFFDTNLSSDLNQACASCHDTFAGFTAPDAEVNRFGVAMPGSITDRFGPRKVPTATYATLIGPNFWDGRATGDTVTDRIFPDGWNAKVKAQMTALDTPAADQAMGPFLNPVEMNLPDAETLCLRVAAASYVDLWEGVWGEPINCDTTDEAIPASNDLPALNGAELTHQRIAFAINVFEHTLNTFTSFRDQALKKDKDGAFPLDAFNTVQNNGHDLYYDAIQVPDPTRPGRTTGITNNGCARFCHSSSFRADGTLPEEIYAPQGRARFFNIGVPRNPDNPFYDMPPEYNPDGHDFVDYGRYDVTGDEADKGLFKVPTMRNLVSGDLPRAYFHNAFFRSLKEVIHFYNTRDLKPVCTQPDLTAAEAIAQDCWPVAEVEENIFDCGIPGTRDTEHCKVPLQAGESFATWCDTRAPTPGVPANGDLDVGNLCLTGEQEDELVEYLKTLTDQKLIRAVEIE